MKVGLLLLVLYVNAQFPVRFSHLRLDNLDKKEDMQAETVEWDLSFGFLNRILDSMDLFKKINDVGPELTEESLNLMMNMNRGNVTRFLGIYGMEYPETDQFFPPRPSVPFPGVTRGVFNNTAWRQTMPTMIQVLLRGNITSEEIFRAVSPQRAIRLTSLLHAAFPPSTLCRMGKASKASTKKSKPAMPPIPLFLLEDISPLEIIFSILLMILFPDLFKPEEEEPESDETEDEDGNVISRRAKRNQPPKPRTRGNPLCNIMQSLRFAPFGLNPNVTLSKNETDMVMSFLNDDEVKKFDYAKGKTEPLRKRFLEITKTELRKDALPPVDPNVGCRVRRLIAKEFSRAHPTYSLKPGAKVPLSIRTLMKATQRVPPDHAQRIRDILLAKPRLRHPDRELHLRKIPAIMKVLAGAPPPPEKTIEASLPSGIALKVQKMLSAAPSALQPQPPEAQFKSPMKVLELLTPKHAMLSSAQPAASEKDVLRYLSSFDGGTSRRPSFPKKRTVLPLSALANVPHDSQTLI